jgi:hypothetical protein
MSVSKEMIQFDVTLLPLEHCDIVKPDTKPCLPGLSICHSCFQRI